MKNGFVKVAAVTPEIIVADCEYNGQAICNKIDEVVKQDVEMVVFPELCVTGYTCTDLFWQTYLIENAYRQVLRIAEYTEGKDILVVVGFPFENEGELFNAAAVMCNGKVIGIVPKKNLPNYAEFYEARHFSEGYEKVRMVQFGGEEVPFGMNIIFKWAENKDFRLSVELCEDVWVPLPPSTNHALAGATVIANLSASDELTGKDIYRRNLVSGQSARLICGYVYADAGEGESSTDFVYGAHNIVAENGNILKEAERFRNENAIAEIDLDRIRNERRKMTTFGRKKDDNYTVVTFSMRASKAKLARKYDQTPFVPHSKKDRDRRCEEILNIQALGLKKRLKHTHAKSAVIGISGGLDSTLALLVTARAFDMLDMDRSNIVAVTMPGFGTTDRTYNNAVELVKILGATLKEINISEAVTLHFKQIEHNPEVRDVTYENSQARQRTLLLMNLANEHNGLVIGTGDLSELALGWATYNGDHMSMYAVNASVPKTLVRHLVKYYSDTCCENELSDILEDILDTPVSPELLPPENGEIAQKTEDLVGPYELHDFYLYYMLRMGYTPEKILELAKNAFDGVYDAKTIKKWLKTFYRRFFAQQFKRSCLPDGPKVGSVAVSPRGDLKMPSDASGREFVERVE